MDGQSFQGYQSNFHPSFDRKEDQKAKEKHLRLEMKNGKEKKKLTHNQKSWTFAD
jgi:hypothetical protein